MLCGREAFFLWAMISSEVKPILPRGDAHGFGNYGFLGLLCIFAASFTPERCQTMTPGSAPKEGVHLRMIYASECGVSGDCSLQGDGC